MICPFCNFQRTSSHTNALWECPNCKKAYNKFKPHKKAKFIMPTKSTRRVGITVIDLLCCIIGVAFLWFGFNNLTESTQTWAIICIITGVIMLLPVLRKSSESSWVEFFDSDFFGGSSDGGGDSGGDSGGGGE